MTSLPPNADELVSAYLDGEAAPDEIAIVEASSELLERVESLRGLSSRVGAPIAPPAELREAHIAAALAEFDLLGATETPGTSETTAAPLAAVPSPAAPASSTEPPAESGVTSLAAARERKTQRRRFSPGIIAAAAAALLLFVGLAALSIGRGGDDSLSVAEEAPAAATDVTSANDAALDTAEAEDAMDDDEEAMADEEAFSAARGNALSQATVPQATAVMADEEAMADDEEAMEDDEEAMAEAEPADDDAAASDEADSAGDSAAPEPADTAPPQPADFFLGEFDNQAELDRQLQRLSTDDLDSRLRSNGGAGLFPNCQAEIPELAGDISTLIAEAFVAGEAVEVHLVPNNSGGEDAQTAFIVDPTSCTVTSTIDY